MISRRDTIVGYLVLSLAALISLGPLLGVVILSLGEPGKVGIKIDIAKATNFGNYADVWERATSEPPFRRA